MANKMTKRDYFQILRDTYPTSAENYQEVVAFIDHELDLLDKKNSAKRPTARQIENEALEIKVLNYMEPNVLYSISDLIKSIPELEGFSTQRVSPMLRKLDEKGKVERIEDKRKTFYQLVK